MEPRCALLLRGITYCPRYVHFSRAVHLVDFRATAVGLIERLIEPLAARYGGFQNLDLFVATYAAGEEHDREVERTFGTHPMRLCGARFAPYSRTASSQSALLSEGLDMVASFAAYDRVVVARFDMAVHEGADLVGSAIPRAPHDTRFLLVWREGEASWSLDRRVGDALYSLPGGAADMDAFRAALQACPVRTNMHYIYAHLLLALRNDAARIAFMLPVGYYNSDTDLSANPLYRLHRQVLRRYMLHNPNFYRRFASNMPVA